MVSVGRIIRKIAQDLANVYKFLNTLTTAVLSSPPMFAATPSDGVIGI